MRYNCGVSAQAFAKCSAEVDSVVIASIPNMPQCIATLKEDFRVDAEYSEETGKFVIEGSFEQLSCAQVVIGMRF